MNPAKRSKVHDAFDLLEDFEIVLDIALGMGHCGAEVILELVSELILVVFGRV